MARNRAHPVSLPFGGVSDKLPFVAERGQLGTVPPECLSNIIPFAEGTERLQLCTAPGVSKVFSARLGTGPGQALCSAEMQSTITGYTPASCLIIDDGTSLESVAINGNLWMTDAAPSLDRVVYHDVTGLSGPAGNGVQAVKVSRDFAYFAAVSNYVNSSTSRIQATIRVYDAVTFAQVWAVTISSSSIDRYVNAIVFTNDWLCVATNERVQLYRITNGALVQNTNLNGWSSETIGLAVTDDAAESGSASGEHLYVLFTGSDIAGACTSSVGVPGAQAIDAGDPARCFRAGVMKFQVLLPAIVDIGGVPLVQLAFGAGLSASDPFCELGSGGAAHGYFRFSESSVLSPRGCFPIAIKADQDGNLFVARTNSGYGPTSAGWPADISEHQAVTLCKITPAGAMSWEGDPAGIVEIGLGGGYNDIPTGAGDEPSLTAIAVDESGDVYAGGRRNAVGASAYKLRGTDGALLWRASLMPTGGAPHKVVREGGITINAAGNPVFVGDRNASWATSFGGTVPGTDAHYWELDAFTGDVVRTFDLGASVSGLGIDAFPDGRTVYGTDKVAGTALAGSSWSYSGGVWTMAGAAVRTTVIADPLFALQSSVKIQCATTADGVRALLLSSGAGDSAYELGIFGANIQIRKATFGVTDGSAVSNGASDLPMSTACSAAHGLPAGQPFEIEARWVGNDLQVYLDGVEVLRHEVAANEPYRAHRHFGFVANVIGARALRVEYCALIASYSQPREVLIGVCDNNVHISTNGFTAQLVASAVFSHGGTVSTAYFQQKVYAAGGGKLVIIDPVAQSVVPFVPTAGSLPGATPSLPGSTTIKLVAKFMTRVAYAAGSVLYGSAVDDATDLDTGSPNEGRAFAINVGETILGMREIADGVLIVGTANNVYRLIGDVGGLGPQLLRQVKLGAGLSGKDAICPIEYGSALCHGPEGLYLIGQEGDAVPFSQSVLTKGLTFPRGQVGQYAVQVIRDFERKHLHSFVMPDGAIPPVGPFLPHFDTIYAEQAGMFEPGKPGYYPRTLPYRLGPTASCNFRGQLVCFSRDGYVWKFDASATTDDGQALTSKVCAAVIDDPDSSNDTLLEEAFVTLGLDSDGVSLRFYGGRTPQEAYVGSRRISLTPAISIRPDDSGRCLPMRCKAPAIVAEITTSAGDAMLLEDMEVRTRRDPMRTGPQPRTPAMPPAPPGVPVAPDEDDGFGTGGGVLGVFVELFLGTTLPEGPEAPAGPEGPGEFTPSGAGSPSSPEYVPETGEFGGDFGGGVFDI